MRKQLVINKFWIVFSAFWRIGF